MIKVKFFDFSTSTTNVVDTIIFDVKDLEKVKTQCEEICYELGYDYYIIRGETKWHIYKPKSYTKTKVLVKQNIFTFSGE